jgi:hypothetical protein
VSDEILDKYDMDGDRLLTPKDPSLFDQMVSDLNTEDESGDVREDVPAKSIGELEELTDIDGGGKSATADDVADFRETVGALIVEAVLSSTPAEC